jgi:3-oxoacyl-[acyl-carrier-protein] synthase II
MLVLEEFEHARDRGTAPLAEIVAFATNNDGAHVTCPEVSTQAIVMRTALEQARLSASDIGFISGHGTATESGDIVETQATADVFGRKIPFHSLKGHFGHSLGACGAIEAWLSIAMMNDGWLPPTANLTDIDPRCAELDYVVECPRTIAVEHFASNNFAFGGINTSLIFRRVDTIRKPDQFSARGLPTESRW